jgi:hypothetical protein
MTFQTLRVRNRTLSVASGLCIGSACGLRLTLPCIQSFGFLGSPHEKTSKQSCMTILSS